MVESKPIEIHIEYQPNDYIQAMARVQKFCRFDQVKHGSLPFFYS